MSEKLYDIIIVSIITIVIVFISSILIFEFEGQTNPEVNNFFDAVWLTSVTITSLGYGDSYPITIPGRILGIFLMFFSIVLVGAIAGIVSHNFIGQKKKRRKTLSHK